jgi:hypothetical protein
MLDLVQPALEANMEQRISLYNYKCELSDLEKRVQVIENSLGKGSNKNFIFDRIDELITTEVSKSISLNILAH